MSWGIFWQVIMLALVKLGSSTVANPNSQWLSRTKLNFSLMLHALCSWGGLLHVVVTQGPRLMEAPSSGNSPRNSPVGGKENLHESHFHS